MPESYVAFSEDEYALIRQQAARAAVAPEAFVHDAALAVVPDRRSAVPAAAAQIAELGADLNARLAQGEAPSGLADEAARKPRRRASSHDRRVQIAAAKARVSLDQRLSLPTPPWIIQLANEKP
jgi:hypothetical protein